MAAATTIDERTPAYRIGRLRTAYAILVCTREPKACGCGARHDGTGWAGLPLVGWNDDGVEVLELRNCPCGSTLAVEVPA